MTDNCIATGSAPRITEESIKAKIDSEMYIRTPEQGLTLCKVQMKNGFCFIGHSACVSPENYNRDLGDSLALKSAIRQIWSHEGYLLKECLFERARLAALLADGGMQAIVDGDLQASLGQPAHD